MAKVYDAQGEADKAARRICREAYARGGTVPYTLGRLIELKLSLKVIRAVYRNPLAEQVAQAKAEVAGWSPERRAACQLEGGGSEPWIEQEVVRAAAALRERGKLNSRDDQTHE